jgi:thioredoxin-dependent peroxiredoxin
MRKALRLMSLAGALCGLAAASAAADELKVGDKAPNFSLQASDGKTYSLADFTGKQAVVLAWFPKAYTRGCTIECKSLAEHGDMIKAYDAKYFMISVDTLDDNKGFADQQHADFPLLADPSKKTAEAYGVLNPQAGFAYRWTFYIAKDGTISAIDKTVKPETSAEDMAAKLKELKVPTRRSTN